MPWIIAKSLGSSFNDLLKTIKTIFTHITVSFSLTQGSPPLPRLDFGLFSAVGLPLEPTIPFSYSSAVSPSKSHDFRLYAPTIPFFPVSGFEPTIPLATNGQRFALPVSNHENQSEAKCSRPITNQTRGCVCKLTWEKSLCGRPLLLTLLGNSLLI